MSWREEYRRKLVSVEEATKVIKSGDHFIASPGGSCPVDFLTRLADRADELKDVTITSGLLFVPLPHLYAKYRGRINHHAVFFGPLERFFLGEGNIETTSYNFSQSEHLFSEVIPANIGVLEVSPPNEKGYMSYGPLGTFANDYPRWKCETTIVQVNGKMPWINGTHSHIHVSEVDYICEADHELPIAPYVAPTEAEKIMAKYIVEKIPDGACIQIGVGKIPNAVGEALVSKNDLGIHTEMISDCMLPLWEKGVINNSRKTLHRDKNVAGAAVGTKPLYDFIDNNPTIDFLPISYVNDPLVLSRIDDFTSINSALTVDLTGQICSESIGFSQYSGTGGQLDFVMGSTFSKGGQSFIALNSVAGAGKGKPVSRIVCVLDPGTVVSTPRSLAEYIVTEHGMVNLKNKSINYRVNAMISVAHPDFRDQLREQAYDAGLIRRDWKPAWTPDCDTGRARKIREARNG